MRDTERKRGRDTGRGRSRLHAGNPTWDSIPRLQDHTLGWRQVLNRWATQASHPWPFLVYEWMKPPLAYTSLGWILCLHLYMVEGSRNVYYYFLRFYLFIHERHTDRERQRPRQREKPAPCREPDSGLNPGSPGSCPGLKAALNCWATRTALEMFILRRKTPRRDMNAFQIFEGCWAEELLEYSVCLQGVKLESVGRCFRWSDFRAV